MAEGRGRRSECEGAREKNQQQHERQGASERQTDPSGFHQRRSADGWTRTNGAEHLRTAS